MSRKAVIINTIFDALFFLPSFGLQLTSVMSGVVASNEAGLTGFLGMSMALLGYFFPAAFLVSIGGMWITHLKGKERMTRHFAWFPWIYLGLILSLTVLFFLLG